MARPPMTGTKLEGWFYGLDLRQCEFRPVGLVRHTRDPYLAPWLGLAEVRVLLSLRDASGARRISLESYVARMVVYRQSASEHWRRLRAAAGGPTDGREIARLDQFHQQHGALMPMDGLVDPRNTCGVTGCTDPRHPRCRDPVDVTMEIARHLALEDGRLNQLAVGLIDAASLIAPLGVRLCAQGWFAVMDATWEWSDNRIRVGEKRKLSKTQFESTGKPIAWARELNAIQNTRKHLDSLRDCSDDELKALFVSKVLGARPSTAEAKAGGAFDRMLAAGAGRGGGRTAIPPLVPLLKEALERLRAAASP